MKKMIGIAMALTIATSVYGYDAPSYNGFGVTTDRVAMGGDKEAMCQSTFGTSAKLADWTEIEAYYAAGGSLETFVSELQLETYGSLIVSLNGDESYSSSREYFVSYHNHNKPGNYLAHDNIDNYYLSLGSWHGDKYVLCSNVLEESCSGIYTQSDLDTQYQAGMQYCITNPSACGIATDSQAAPEGTTIAVNSGWQLSGSSVAIDTDDFASLFDASCVSEVYYFSGSWYHYVAGGSASGLIDIPANSGFWIKATASCTLSTLRYSEEECNLGYVSMSADDKAWCDAAYY